MMHKAWSSIEEVPYCFSRSYVIFLGHTALKIVEFYPNWAFPDCNSSLNSLMAMKCRTKLETAKERCPIVFQGHPSNFKVTRDKTSPILTQIGRFRTIGRSQLSNPSDLPCFNIMLSHTDEIVIHPYEIATIPTYEIGMLFLCHTHEMLCPTYEIATDFMSYGRISKPYAWDRWTVAMSYKWDVKSYVWDSNTVQTHMC